MTPEHTHYHEESQVVCFTTISYSGFELNVTARQGATKDVILDTCRELVKALAELEKAGASPVVKSYHNGNGNGNGSKAANAALATATHAPTADEEAWNALQSASAQRAQAAQVAQSAPVTMQAPTLANGAEDPGYCKVHRVAMKRHEKDSQVWYSHKAPDGSWCRGKYNPPSLGY